MSKKINISLSDKSRPSLVDAFHAWLERSIHERSNRSSHYYEDDVDEELLMWALQNGWDLDDEDLRGYMGISPSEDDDSSVVFPFNEDLERTKRISKGKKKSGKYHDDDVYDNYWSREERKYKHKHKKNKGGRARIIDLNTPYSGFIGDDDDSDAEYTEYEDVTNDYGVIKDREDFRVIWYYPDHRNMDDKIEFDTLKDFDDFCADNGFVVPPYVGEQIAYREVSHVCLRPDAREEGIYEVMAEDDYASMYYEASNSNSLGY